MCQWNSGGKRHSQKEGILPTPYHGNRYSIPEPCAKCKDIFCILPLFFYVLVPVQLYLRQLLFAQQNCGGDQIQQHRKQHGCIVAAHRIGHGSGAVPVSYTHLIAAGTYSICYTVKLKDFGETAVDGEVINNIRILDTTISDDAEKSVKTDSLVITSQADPSDYELPSTGGAGTKLYTAGGGALDVYKRQGVHHRH